MPNYAQQELSKCQDAVYKRLFNEHNSFSLSSDALRRLKFQSRQLFGYNIINAFLIKSKYQNLAYYLKNIILHTQYVTFLVEGAEKYFKNFYEQVAKLCVDLIQGEYEPRKINIDGVRKDRQDIFTRPFTEFLQKTILYSLQQNQENTRNIETIFMTTISNIIHESYMSKIGEKYSSVSDGVSKVYAFRLARKEHDFLDNYSGLIQKIIDANSIIIDEAELHKRKNGLFKQQKAECQNLAVSKRYKRPLAVVCTIIFLFAAVATFKTEIFPFFLIFMVGSLRMVFYYSDAKKNQIKQLGMLNEQLESDKKELISCTNLIPQQHTVDQVTYTIFCLAHISPVSEQQEYSKKEEEGHLYSSKPGRKREKLLFQAKSSSSKQSKILDKPVPQNYTRHGKQLIFFNPKNVNVFDKEKVSSKKGAITKFSEKSYNVFPLKFNSKWNHAKINGKQYTFDYKLKCLGNRERAFGVKAEKVVNEKKETICKVIAYAPLGGKH